MAFWISLLESDADLVAATTVADGPIFVAATKIRIGRGTLLRQGQAPLRRLLLRIMPSPWRPVPACVRNDIPQAGHSPAQQRWRCIDSQVWARNQESMQPLGCSRGFLCIVSVSAITCPRYKKSRVCALLFFSPFVWEEVPVCFGFGSGRHGGRSVEYIRQVVEEVDAHLTA